MGLSAIRVQIEFFKHYLHPFRIKVKIHSRQMMTSTPRLLRIAGVLAVLAASAFAALGGTSGTDARARAKARHYFALASRAGAEGKYDRAYEYSAKAHKADPTYVEASLLHANHRLMAESDTLRSVAELRRTLRMASQYVDTYPEDFNESAMYAYWAVQMDTVSEGIRIYERLEQLFPTHTEVLPELSEAYLRAGRTRDAIDALSRYEKVEGYDPRVAMRKISMYINLRDTVGALAEADSLVVRNPSNGTLRIVRGTVWEYLDNPGNALVDYLDAERLAPESSIPKFALAQYYATHGDTVQYDRKTYEGLISDDLEPDDRISRVGEYIGRLMADSVDQTARAEALINNLRDKYPHDPKILVMSGLYYYMLDDIPLARETLNYATDLDPTNADAWRTLISLLAREEDFAAVVETSGRMAKYVKPNVADRQTQGIALMQLGRADEAVEMYTGMLREAVPGIEPDSLVTDKRLRSSLGSRDSETVADIYMFAGDAYYELKQPEKAFTAYENSLFFDPYNSMTLNNYAYYLALSGGDLDKAEKMSRQSMEDQPENPTFIDTHAWILYLKGDWQKALEEQLQAITLAEEQGMVISTEFYDHLGDIYYRLGQVDEAVDNWKKALELKPGDEDIQNKVRLRRVS